MLLSGNIQLKNYSNILDVFVTFSEVKLQYIMTKQILWKICTIKILKIGTPEIITIIVLHLEQLDFTVQYCVQKMQTE